MIALNKYCLEKYEEIDLALARSMYLVAWGLAGKVSFLLALGKIANMHAKERKAREDPCPDHSSYI